MFRIRYLLLLTLLPFSSLTASTSDTIGPVSSEKSASVSSAGSWVIRNHGCPGGNRTDALHRDDDGTLWAGCGTAAEGYGLYRSQDGGDQWSLVSVNPADLLHQFRVSSISRGHDGALMVAGFQASTWNMVLRLDTSVTPIAGSVALVGVNQVGRLFHVGTYRELSDGRAIAEALNSGSLLYRPSSSTGSSASLWTVPPSPLFQILDMTVSENAFYGVGSTIAEPPRVFLPPTAPGALPYEWTILELPSPGWNGEMWGVAVNASRMVAVGIDQNNNIGKIFVSQGSPYNNTWTVHDLPDIVGAGGAATWARGACMRGDTIVVVGERQPLSANTGLVMMSVDGGLTFQNITPPGVASTISKCLIEPDGAVVVAGAGGFIGIRMGELIFSNGFES